MFINPEQVKRRIYTLFHGATELEIAQGLDWYQLAHLRALNLARTYGLSLKQVAGVISVLSPGVKWAINLADAEELIKRPDASTICSTYDTNKLKALKIIAGGSPDVLIKSRKTKAFFKNILSPADVEHVTIDRHMINAVVSGALTDNEKSKVFNTKRYDVLADCFRKEAGILGIRPNQLQAIVWTVQKGRYEPEI